MSGVRVALLLTATVISVCWMIWDDCHLFELIEVRERERGVPGEFRNLSQQTRQCFQAILKTQVRQESFSAIDSIVVTAVIVKPI